jgi:hypothetical protein
MSKEHELTSLEGEVAPDISPDELKALIKEASSAVNHKKKREKRKRIFKDDVASKTDETITTPQATFNKMTRL